MRATHHLFRSTRLTLCSAVRSPPRTHPTYAAALGYSSVYRVASPTPLSLVPLRFPLARAVAQASVLTLLLASPHAAASPPPSDPFSNCYNLTGRNASVILQPSITTYLYAFTGKSRRLAPGDEIGAFTPEGRCAGQVVWEGEAAVLTLWEDDPMTAEQDGFVPGDAFTLRVRSASEGQLFRSVQIVYDSDFDETGLYGTDAIYAVTAITFFQVFSATAPGSSLNMDDVGTTAKGLATAPPDDYTLAASYPNPFQSSTTIRYGLPEEAAVGLEVYDALGRHVTTLVDGVQPAGWHEAVLPARGLTAGLYVVRLRAGDFAAIRRITLVR